MSIRSFLITILGLLVLLEGVLAYRRNAGVEPSTAPVFSLALTDNWQWDRGAMAYEVGLYGADWGAKSDVVLDEGISLTLMYFEWKKLEFGPLMEIAAHRPEICNTAAGFRLKEIMKPVVFQPLDKPSLVFDRTWFISPSGQDVFVFKLPWMQGIGTLDMRSVLEPNERIRRAFIRNTGEARVLIGGIFGARDSEQAWGIFQREVLEKLEWGGVRSEK